MKGGQGPPYNSDLTVTPHPPPPCPTDKVKITTCPLPRLVFNRLFSLCWGAMLPLLYIALSIHTQVGKFKIDKLTRSAGTVNHIQLPLLLEPFHLASSQCKQNLLRLDSHVGYSDFHNLVGFTIKKMPNNILFVKKSFSIGYAISCEWVSRLFRNLYADFKSMEIIGKKCTQKKSFAKNFSKFFSPVSKPR